MKRAVSRFTLVLALCAIVNALGCSDEVAVTLDEVEAAQQEILDLFEQHQQATQEHGWAELIVMERAQRYSRELQALRSAHATDTWIDIALARTGNTGASGRSIVITYLRELEDERTRLENLVAESQP